MATDVYYWCERCKDPESPETLFNAIRDHAEEGARRCPSCGRDMYLCLKFGFGLGVRQHEFWVVDAFRPSKPDRWKDDSGVPTTFYPFLVVLERKGRKRSVWLPYWHVQQPPKGREVKKYGQWAPNMGLKIFEDLLSQAQAKGLLDSQ